MSKLHLVFAFLLLLNDVVPAQDCSDEAIPLILRDTLPSNFERVMACSGAIQRSAKNAAMFFDHIAQLHNAGRTTDVLRLLNAAVLHAPSNPNFSFLQGSVLASSGRLEEATLSYERAVINHPTHVDALHNYAAILMDLPQHINVHRDRIVRSLNLALRLLPNSPKLKISAGVMLSELGYLSKASMILLQATKLEQDSALAYGALGRSLEGLGHDRQAEIAFLHAFALAPHDPETLRAVGYLYMAQERFGEACTWFEKVLALRSHDPRAMTGMGECLRGQRKRADALRFYQAAAVADPLSSESWSNLGSCLVENGNAAEAFDALQKALAIQPKLPQAQTTAGYALVELGRHNEAGQFFRAAVEVEPHHATGWNNLGHFLRFQGKLGGAVEAGERAVALEPTALHLYNLAESLRLHARLPDAILRLQQALELDPDAADVAALLIFYRRLACDWSRYTADTDRLQQLLSSQQLSGDQTALFAVQTLIFALPTRLHLFSASSLATASLLRTRLRPLSSEPRTLFRDNLFPRLLAGYITSDLGKHPVSDDLQAVWRAHDPARVSFQCFLSPSGRSADGGVGTQHPCWAGAGAGIVDLREMSTREAAERVSEARVVVLVDLHGWTAGHAMDLLAYSPAPVQVSFKGFPGSTGATFIDLLVGDRIATPPEHREQWTEKLLLLPYFYHVNGHWRRFHAPPAKPDADRVVFEERGRQVRIPEHSVLLCSFNRQVKFEPDSWAAWMKVLQAVPGSVLWLLRFDDMAETNLLHAAAQAGVPASRIFVTEPLPADVEHAGKAACDLFLDSFLYNAHGTAADALWAQTPIVTLPGSTLPARVAASLALHPHRSLHVTVARTPDDFVAIASALAGQIRSAKTRGVGRGLRALRGAMAGAVGEEGAAGIFDVVSWTREWERGLRLAVDCKHQANEPQNLIVSR